MQYNTKYGVTISDSVVMDNFDRLTKQLWKLIPMRENNEDWLKQLGKVIIEIAGLGEILEPTRNYLILLSKLEGLKSLETDFETYRCTVFESISLLRGMRS